MNRNQKINIVFSLAILLIILNVTDIVTTLIGLQSQYAIEANPLWKPDLLSSSFKLLFMGFTGIVFIHITSIKNGKYAYLPLIALITLNIFYFFIVINNIQVLKLAGVI